MSTLFAIILGVVVSTALRMVLVFVPSLLEPAFEATHTGGPILYGIVYLGLVGYASYAGLYVGMRIFKRASADGAFWGFLILMALMQVVPAFSVVSQHGVTGVGVVAMLTAVFGIAAIALGTVIGQKFAQEDSARALSAA